MRLIIVSGRSGSGKSTALDVLEDNGYYCIDNLPAGLLPELAERALIHTELAQPLVALRILPASRLRNERPGAERLRAARAQPGAAAGALHAAWRPT